MKGAFILSVFLTAAAVGSWAGHSPGRSAGKQFFEGFGCQRCHTIAGEGGEYGPDLTYVGFRKSKVWLDLWLKNPHGWKSDTVMPNLHLSDGVRHELVAYLSSLKGDAYRVAAPWNHEELKKDPVRRGEAIFTRVGCAGCHGRAGVGGYPNNNVAGGKIPTLTAVSDGFSKEELVTKIRVGVPKSDKEDPSGPDPMLHMPAWGQVLKDDELHAVVEYLYSLKPKTASASKDDF